MDVNDGVLDVLTRSPPIASSPRSPSLSLCLVPFLSSPFPLHLPRLLLSFLLRERVLLGSASDRPRVTRAVRLLSASSLRLSRLHLRLSPALRPVLRLVSQQALSDGVGGAAVAAERLLHHVGGLYVSPQLGGQRVAWR